MGPSPIPYAEGKPVPRPLTEAEIGEYVADHAQVVRNAVAARFDGVQIHGANGYLVDQFFHDVSNVREDRIQLSPSSVLQGMRMREPELQFTCLLEGLKELKLVYVHLVEPLNSEDSEVEASGKLDFTIVL